ncbi:DUF6417 family protein [Streptomyces pharetrae]|uniref:DUF6417 family protein n=1 Tax=Streptomyces pharetrae TaxID=291370 RepID=UPI0033561316
MGSPPHAARLGRPCLRPPPAQPFQQWSGARAASGRVATAPDARAAHLHKPVDEPENPPAPGLAKGVRAARCGHGGGRWQLHLDRERMNSAYALRPHALTGSASEANRFARASTGPATGPEFSAGPAGHRRLLAP